MTQIHTTAIVSHGNLNSHVCFVDARFNLKISDYGLPFFRKAKFLQPPKLSSDQEDLANSELYLWRAPELLRMVMPPQGTQVRKIDHFEAQFSPWCLPMLVTRYFSFRLNLWADAVTRLSLLRILCTIHSTRSAEHDRFKQSISFHLISAIKIELQAWADTRENTVCKSIRWDLTAHLFQSLNPLIHFLPFANWQLPISKIKF